MAESTGNKGGKNMSKWLAIAAIGVLVVALVVVIVVFTGQTGDLNTKLDAAEAQIATLQGQLSSAQGNVSSLQTQLTAAQGQATTLQADLTTTRGQVSTLQRDVESKQSTINTQNDQIKTMRYPRHFTTVDELTNWLQKDDTNTLSTGPFPTGIEKVQMAFTLEIRAARAGYLLPVNLPVGGNLELVTNRAVVGDSIYEVRAWDDFAQVGPGRISPALPSYPITPESGK